MRVLFDVNIVLDVLLGRIPWHVEADALWDANLDGRLLAHLATFTIPTVFYVMRKQTDLGKAHPGCRRLPFCPLVRTRGSFDARAARSLHGSDFEDNLQIACAVQSGIDAIVTRDPNGFVASPILVLTPSELLGRLGIPQTRP